MLLTLVSLITSHDRKFAKDGAHPGPAEVYALAAKYKVKIVVFNCIFVPPEVTTELIGPTDIEGEASKPPLLLLRVNGRYHELRRAGGSNEGADDYPRHINLCQDELHIAASGLARSRATSAVTHMGDTSQV